MMKRASTDRLLAAAAAALALVAPTAGAQAPLLPAPQAFALSARALDAGAVEVRFQVADGYYMYRDKFQFVVEPPASAGPVSLPPGKMIEDEFFGKSATFRTELKALIPVKGAKPGSTITLVTDSQGCADVGVCYPPQRQSMVLEVPAAGAGPGAVVHAVPPKKAWFN